MVKYKTIYMADDDPDDRDFFSLALEEVCSSAEFSTFNNGQQLIDKLSNIVENFPDLIFLDINMPLKNGIEVLSYIRSKHATACIPVIMYSTSNAPEMVKVTRALGANLYIVKPSEFYKLKQMIAKVLSMAWDIDNPRDIVGEFTLL